MTYIYDLKSLEDEKRQQADRLRAENMLEIPLWNKGFIRVIDWFGTDRDITRSARVSYGRHEEKRTDEQDKRLIDYLIRHHHSSPFELPQLRIHAKIPIFVARQWVRHRTWSLNEISARYTVLSSDSYIPSLERVKGQSKTNHQASEGELPREVQETFVRMVQENAQEAYQLYNRALGHGVSRELARVMLPLSVYTEVIFSVDLLNLLKFLRLRKAKGAQEEIFECAEALEKIVSCLWPWTYEAYKKHWQGTKSVTEENQKELKELLSGMEISESLKKTLSEW